VDPEIPTVEGPKNRVKLKQDEEAIYRYRVYPACYTGTHPVRIMPANTPLVLMFDFFVSAEALSASFGNGVTAQRP